jgi:transcriptional regulator with XRE-family HTH domain
VDASAEAARIGPMVRSARLRRGLSLEVVAGLVGHSKSWLSKVERGLLPLERRSGLAALADALQVSVADLTGRPYTPDGGPASRLAVQMVRRALLDVPPKSALRPVEALREHVDALTRSRQAFRLEEAAKVAAPALTALRASQADGGADHAEILRLLAYACYETSNLVRDLGYPDLAIVASGVLLDTARELEDPACLAVAAFSRTHALAAVPTSAFAAAVQLGTNAADELDGVPGDEALAARGSLHLATGFALAADGRGIDAVVVAPVHPAPPYRPGQFRWVTACAGPPRPRRQVRESDHAGRILTLRVQTKASPFCAP